jgi:hypothetical protein
MRLLPLLLLGEVLMECSKKLDDVFEDIEPISCCRLNTPFFLEVGKFYEDPSEANNFLPWLNLTLQS